MCVHFFLLAVGLRKLRFLARSLIVLHSLFPPHVHHPNEQKDKLPCSREFIWFTQTERRGAHKNFSDKIFVTFLLSHTQFQSTHCLTIYNLIKRRAIVLRRSNMCIFPAQIVHKCMCACVGARSPCLSHSRMLCMSVCYMVEMMMRISTCCFSSIMWPCQFNIK